MRQLAVLILPIALLISSGTGTKADPEQCRSAIDQYNSAKRDVADELRRYANCIRDSDGHDDCSSEFSRLRSAQDDFESAVSEYESNCQ
jgi:hypothetical protein